MFLSFFTLSSYKSWANYPYIQIISKNVSNNFYHILGGFGDFYTMKRAAPAVSEIDEWTLAKLLEALQDRENSYSKRYMLYN